VETLGDRLGELDWEGVEEGDVDNEEEGDEELVDWVRSSVLAVGLGEGIYV